MVIADPLDPLHEPQVKNQKPTHWALAFPETSSKLKLLMDFSLNCDFRLTWFHEKNGSLPEAKRNNLFLLLAHNFSVFVFKLGHFRYYFFICYKNSSLTAKGKFGSTTSESPELGQTLQPKKTFELLPFEQHTLECNPQLSNGRKFPHIFSLQLWIPSFSIRRGRLNEMLWKRKKPIFSR